MLKRGVGILEELGLKEKEFLQLQSTVPKMWTAKNGLAESFPAYSVFKIPEGARLIEPFDYLEFLQLESEARLILTDNGGVKEEACILRVVTKEI